jgi:hypothetical protein
MPRAPPTCRRPQTSICHFPLTIFHEAPMSAPLTTQNSALSTSTPLNPEPRTLSPARLAANRANALKSTGPRTPEGKAKSALNSTKHGLTSHTPLLPSEDPTEFLLFQDGMLEELNPLTTQQLIRAQAVIEVSWKLHRYRITESTLLQKQADSYAAADLRNWEQRCKYIENENYAKRRSERSPMPEKPSHQYTAEELLALSFFATDGRSPLQLLDRYRSSLLRQLSKLTREYRELQAQQNEAATAADPDPRATDNRQLATPQQDGATEHQPNNAPQTTDRDPLATDNRQLATLQQNEASILLATDDGLLTTDNNALTKDIPSRVCGAGFKSADVPCKAAPQ